MFSRCQRAQSESSNFPFFRLLCYKQRRGTKNQIIHEVIVLKTETPIGWMLAHDIIQGQVKRLPCSVVPGHPQLPSQKPGWHLTTCPRSVEMQNCGDYRTQSALYHFDRSSPVSLHSWTFNLQNKIEGNTRAPWAMSGYVTVGCVLATSVFTEVSLATPPLFQE